MNNNSLRVLLLGDLVGVPGQTMVQKHLDNLKKDYNADAVIVNGENSAHGHGITSKIMRSLLHNGVDIVTSGNHIWRNKEIYPYLDQHTNLLRPANFPAECPGTGVTTFSCKGVTIGILNLQGRVFMRELVSCPFREADSILTYLKSKTPIILVDFHAETTAEKIGMGFYLDGRVSGVVGTHTHVQTADERILPEGTAFITDLGMAGSLSSMIGMKKGPILKNMLTQMPHRFEVEMQGPYVLSGVCIEIDKATGVALKIERVRIVDHELKLEEH